MHLVIGATGLIGTALCDELGRRNLPFKGTTRYPGCEHPWLIGFDLRFPSVAALPECSVLYLVAAIAGFGPCEDNQNAWRINVDANNELIDRYPDAFVVFISSDVVEKTGAAFYQLTKREIEQSVRAVRGARIRPERVVGLLRAGQLAKVIVDEGLARRPGGLRWPSLERF